MMYAISCRFDGASNTTYDFKKNECQHCVKDLNWLSSFCACILIVIYFMSVSKRAMVRLLSRECFPPFNFCSSTWLSSRSDNRGTKSPWRLWDNWRKQHLGVIIWSYCCWLFHTVWRLFYHFLTAHSSHCDLYMTLKYISNDTNLLHYSRVNPFSSINFTRNGRSTTNITLRGHSFTLALCTVLKLFVKLILLGCTLCWYQYLRVTKPTLC